MEPPDLRQAATLLRFLIEACRDGTLSADGPASAALVRQMQGAAVVLELIAEGEPRPATRHGTGTGTGTGTGN